MRSQIQATGREVFFKENEIIVSKTDTTGKITYANDVFLRVAGYTEEEILGKPHSIIRHPAMPRCVFQLLWDTIQQGQEIFAYVINLAKNGDHYWVFAHVTPTFDGMGNIIGYHSNRRVPERGAVDLMTGLYADLCQLEQKASSKREAIELATAALVSTLESKSLEYDEFVFSIQEA